MKSKNRNRGRKLQKLTLESLESRHLLATLAPGVSFIDPTDDLAPSVRFAFEYASDLTQYSNTELTNSDWVVRLNEGHFPSEITSTLKLQNWQLESTNIDRTFVIQASAGYSGITDTLETSDAVEYFYPLVKETHSKKAEPNDPRFDDQWHLQNTGQTGGLPGEDINVVNAWNNVTGDGIVIGIVDDGVDGMHPELVENYRTDLSFDYGDGDGDASPLDPVNDTHGTAVAGVAAAAGDNEIGVAGVAYDVQVAGLRLLVPQGFDDQQAGDALSHEPNEIDIYNNSWGPADGFAWYAGPGPMAAQALFDATADGRNNLGNIHTWAAGNGLQFNDNSNYDGYANSIDTIAVTAVNHEGTQAFYAEPGANILVAAPSDPSGIVTIDNAGNDGATPYNGPASGIGVDGLPIDGDDDSNYREDFGGTSSATPVVSGVVALMLEANPTLTYRDVEHIIVHTARMNDPTDGDWRQNAAGHDINHKYGFGVIDAEAAVEMASAWNNVGPQLILATDNFDVNQDIPDNNRTGTQFGITIPATLDDGSDLTEFSIEHVTLLLETNHPFRGDLEVILTSPDGTESVLAEPHLGDAGELFWQFSSVRHWGEMPVGLWSVTVSDQFPLSTGMIESAQLQFSGTGSIGDIPEIIITPPTDNGVIAGTIFNDLNGDGIQNGGEEGLLGHTAFLDSNNNGLLDEGEATAISGSTGNYFFTGLAVGSTHTIGYICNVNSGSTVVQAVETRITTVGLSGISSNNNFASSEDCLPFDQVGQEDQSIIEGIIFNDIDGDGVQDLGEEGIADQVVYADVNNNCVIGLGEPAGRTNASGHYNLAVTEGSYFIRMVPRPGTQLSACQGSLVTAPGDVSITHNIGFAGDNEYDYAADGTAEHGIFPGLNLGNLVSSDSGFDDNDGIVFTTGLHPGRTEDVIVVANKLDVSTAYLQGWIDWNADGDYNDSNEQVFRNVLLTNGINNLQITVPSNAAVADVNALFRYGFERGINPTKPALGGEAESYVLTVPSDRDTGINAVADSADVIAGESVTIDVLANDTSGPLSGSLMITDVSSSNAVITGDTIVYTPAADSGESETFTYTITDSLGGTDTATVAVSVLLDFPIARDDQFSTLTGSSDNEFDVLPNDLSAPNTAASSITSVQTATDQGGTAAISADGSNILYTPNPGFEGTDTFTYAITGENGETNTATVSVTVSPSGPIVEMTLIVTDLDGNPIDGTLRTGQQFQLQGFVEDLRDPAEGVFSAYMDVLIDNPSLVTVDQINYGDTYQDNQSGEITSGLIDEIGATDGLTPLGPGQFHLFTIDLTAVGSGTVSFTGDPADVLPANETSVYGLSSAVPNSLIDFINDSIAIERAATVDFQFDVTDTAGNPIENVNVGDNFVLDIYVQDLTTRDQTGVFSAYLDVLFDSALVSVNGDIEYGSSYPNNQSGDAVTSPGLIDELGAADGFTPLGSAPVLLASVPLTANGNGTVTFTGNPADEVPPHETTLFGESAFVDPLDMRFTSDSVIVGSPTAQSRDSYTNETNTLDVNGDGSVSPIDALAIINDLNRNGARLLPRLSNTRATSSSSAVAPVGQVDVNSDGYASPIDALLVINHLNNPNPVAKAALSSAVDAAPAVSDQVLSVWSDLDADDDDETEDEWVADVAAEAQRRSGLA